jgi:hypothetical protein
MKYALMIPLAVLPLLTSAQTYHYVTQSGITADVDASSATEALVTAPNIAYNSGVAIDRGLIKPGMDIDNPASVTTAPYGVGGDAEVQTYFYVDVNGIVKSVIAPNAAIAISKASDIAPHSGVALDQGLLQAGLPVTAQ